MGYGATFPKLKSYYRSSPGTVFRYHFPLAKRANGFAKSMAIVKLESSRSAVYQDEIKSNSQSWLENRWRIEYFNEKFTLCLRSQKFIKMKLDCTDGSTKFHCFSNCHHGFLKIPNWPDWIGTTQRPNQLIFHTHRIHGTGIFTYTNGWFWWLTMVNVGKYTIHGFYGIQVVVRVFLTLWSSVPWSSVESLDPKSCGLHLQSLSQNMHMLSYV